ncbi:MAG: lipoate--protein ligase family protein [Microcystis viridis Mv_BB_P_19951000_S69]|uniref:Lipoate--protein ligase family protein n=1 Tax=Microcystis viridis Mv_BB_P_19951000_S68D TaxID=2486270 RepID=A0A552HMA0_MICVR|nr:MAG: lipoate--protein ligase family protein [Microcystis viridis Mv_BB_P_19951000_S69]TRU72359.1 MAG: lipoate--protein ligase family protein [Microcystis viridis Mv_BB_P_19951000_S68D]TRU77257.1 MAG: lipoate--protein ligase family protein [Microcystis viridis Mv_BB_P_19951000_S68]TRU84008.1 MAG: lipoate--protein ligase family protein [Microcystis viridis Mv_BB_P_19951000_S69D]
MMKCYENPLVAAKIWRYIPPIISSAELQMAIDSWLLEQHRCSHHPPTLRFYQWSPPAISLGYHQRQYPDFWRNLTWQGQKISLVRRPTGGRAVLHQGDLTYMVVNSGMKGNIREVYQQICQFLITGWQNLGLELSYGAAGRGYIHSANCFGTATGADLVDNWGNKFIGSAQLQRGCYVLQHGSMVLEQDNSLFEQVFASSAPQKLNLAPDLTLETIIATLKTAAEECFDCQLLEQPLGDWEWQSIKKMNINTY